jgi:hypothetical protein
MLLGELVVSHHGYGHDPWRYAFRHGRENELILYETPVEHAASMFLPGLGHGIESNGANLVRLPA